MNKKEFVKLLNEVTKNSSIDSQIELLEKIQNVWMPEIIKRKKKNYTYCPKCKKYIRTKSFIEKQLKEWESGVCVSQDSAGYGYNEYADVLYLIKYSVCPNCRATKMLSRTELEIKNRHNKNGEKV